MRVSPSFIFLVTAISRSRVAVTSAANLYEAEAAGAEIDYLEATSRFLEFDAVGGGIFDVQSGTYPVEADADGGAYNVSDASVQAVAFREASDVFAVSDSLEAAAVRTRPNMLDNQIICGYQGWYGFPGDGAPINRWRHWFRSAPTYGNVTVDMYPSTDEYDVGDLKESSILMPDGSHAKFFSSARPKVVLKHFEWMATYGITGAFHHRFMTDLQTPMHETRTMILRNVKNAAEATGRTYAVSYDISRTGNDVIESLKSDWMMLVDDEGITNSRQYIRQNGLPVLHIWGIGFTTVPVDDATGMQNLIDWFKSEAAGKYRVFLIGGVPSKWRNQTGDSRNGTSWEGIYDSLDGIQPWHVGRWQNTTEFNKFYSDFIADDAAYCKTKGILYMPTMVSLTTVYFVFDLLCKQQPTSGSLICSASNNLNLTLLRCMQK
jgi:hypothetical protein